MKAKQIIAILAMIFSTVAGAFSFYQLATDPNVTVWLHCFSVLFHLILVIVWLEALIMFHPVDKAG